MTIGYNPRIVTDGLVLCLDAANAKSYPGSGTQWKDLSGLGNHGTLVNGPSYANGIMSFDGVDDTVDCGPVSSVGSSLTGFSASVWLKSSSASTRCILENGSNHTTNTFYFFQENSNYFTFEVMGSGYDVVFSNYIYQIDVWYNLVGVWASGQLVNLYTNSVLTSGSRGGSVQSSLRNGNTNLFVGARSGISYPYLGSIPVAQIYNRALTQFEITQNFNALRGRYGI